MPAAAQTSIADLLGNLGLATLREQALATSGEMDLVLVSRDRDRALLCL